MNPPPIPVRNQHDLDRRNRPGDTVATCPACGVRGVVLVMDDHRNIPGVAVRCGECRHRWRVH